MMNSYLIDNGLRVVIQAQDTAGVYCGIAVDAGTRDELEHESGMAHFTEHMTFKGTRQRSAIQIINHLEGVGGELNAFTGKEETVYYCAVQPQHLNRALDLLADIVFNSTYPQNEMEREAEVVIDEIESYNDSPAELIFDEFESIIFPCHGLGRNILGEAEALRHHTSEAMKHFTRRLYCNDRTVLFVCGPVNESKVLSKINRLFTASSLPNLQTVSRSITRVEPSSYTPQTRSVERGVHQAHVMIGTRAMAVPHPDRMALVLLNNILGGPNMNSRLNLSLRERSGLVYTVESNYTGYTDTGLWSIYFGCDQKDLHRCQRLAMREMDRLMQSPLSAQALAKAKQQLIGQLALSYDQHENIATGMGKTFLHYNTYLSSQEIVERINALTAPHLQDVAQRVFNPQSLSTLIYK